jgi:hypothetical protein
MASQSPGDDNDRKAPHPPAKSQGPMEARSSRTGCKRGQTVLEESKLTTLAHNGASAKFSFGKASRFPSRSASTSKELLRSHSSPIFSGQTSTTASDVGGAIEETLLPGDEAGDEDAAAVGGVRFSTDEDEQFLGTSTSSSPLRHPPPPATDRLPAPRIEGSVMRLAEPEQRAAVPRAKSYDPALTLGAGTSSAYQRAPHYSMGGGPSRVADFQKDKEHLADIPVSTSPQRRKAGNAPSAITLMDLKEATKPKKKNQGSRCTFGSQARLQVKGGPMELPISPGPGTYEVPRRCDPEPVWAPASRNGRCCSWSKLSSDRPEMKNPIVGDAAPGDYVLDHPDMPFKAAAPAPIFGHPHKELSKAEWQCGRGSDPGNYDPHSSMREDETKPLFRDTPSFSVGLSRRMDTTGTGFDKPGPGQYNPRDRLSYRIEPSVGFAKSCRLHEVDLVDPDEPPGPGAHQVRKDWKAKGQLFSKGMKMKHVAGLGPVGPGPGAAFPGVPSTLKKGGRSIGINLPRPVNDNPGVGTYSPSDQLTTASAPAFGCLSTWSAPRPPPWREVEQPPVFTLKSGEKLSMTNVPVQFKASGPKWSIMPRRRDPSGYESSSEVFPLVTSLG